MIKRKKADKPITVGNFKEVFQDAFEPFALAIQQDFNKVRDDISGLKSDVSGLKSDVLDLQDGQQRIEQRQIAETRRKDVLSIKIETHEERIVRLEKSSIS